MSWFARKISLIVVGLLILESNESSALGDLGHREWWETTLVYEIWTPTFQDSDGNGIGDFQGIINRLDYLDDLGIETICLNTIFASSPLSKPGFDVSDYENVNEKFGNLSDFDELVEEIHSRDMKVILDVDPNHTSDEHKWFEASKNMVDRYKDYYVWANGSVTPEGTLIPPINQTILRNDSTSTWTYNEKRQQWYYHTFSESEPDLNLENSHVRRDVMRIFSFWLDRGVDGFRITGVPYFFEDFYLGDNYPPASLKNVKFLYNIRAYVDEWTKLNNSNSKYLITGSDDTDEDLLSYYDNKNPETLSVLPSNYCFIKRNAVAGSSANELRKDIEEWLDAIPMNESTNWMLSNSDSVRITSRVGSDRLDALLMLSMLLPGQAHTFYGDEIGLLETPIPLHDRDQNSNETHDFEYYSPVPPMQWDGSVSAGFSSATNLDLPVNDNYIHVNVDKQLDDPRSHLNVFRKTAELRKNPVFRYGDWEIDNINNDTVFVLRRTLTDHPIYVLVINLADKEQIVNMTDLYPDLNLYLDVVVTSGKDEILRKVASRNYIPVLPSVGIVLRSEPSEAQSDPETNVSGEEKKELEISELQVRNKEDEDEKEKAEEKEEQEQKEIKEQKKVEEEGEEDKEEEQVEADKKDQEEKYKEKAEDNEEQQEEVKEQIVKEEKEEQIVKEEKEEQIVKEEKEEQILRDEKEEDKVVEEEKVEKEEATEQNSEKQETAEGIIEKDETAEEKEAIDEKESIKPLEQEKNEKNSELATGIPTEIPKNDDDEVVKKTHENIQTDKNSTSDTVFRRPSATSATATVVSAGKSSEIANLNLITLIIIANYILTRV